LKGRLAAVVKIDAPGFKGSEVRLRLFFEDQEVASAARTVRLREEAGNVFRLEATAPDKRGELKGTVKADDPDRPGQPLPDEATFANNEMSTFVTVAKEKVRVLLVDVPRASEPQGIIDALRSERRLDVERLWLGDDAPDAGAVEALDFKRRRYDVIILGDVTA